MTDPIKCAIYARFSSNNQRDASIEDQIRRCQNAAISKGWIVLTDHIYADRAISGKKINPRTEFKKLLSHVVSGSCPFNKILVDETSRMSRDTKDALGIFSLLTFYDVHVYYVSQGIDTSHESAEQMIAVNGIIDSIYLKNLAKETHRGIEGQVLKGFSGGGRRYGYRSVPVHIGKVDIYGQPEADGYRLVINPEEAETVIRIFRLFSETGYSAKKIVRTFNKELKETGSPQSPRGRWWTVSTILGSRKFRRGILNNEIYIGRYFWNCAKSVINPTNGKRTVRINERSSWQLVHKPHLAIIPERLWQKAKERQRSIRHTSQGRYTKGKPLYSANLLTGLLKCPDCGGNMVIVSGGKYGKYGCSNNWNKGLSVCANDSKFSKPLLEKEVIQKVVPDLSGSIILDYVLKKANSLLSSKFSEAKPAWQSGAIAKELGKIEKEIANIMNAIKAGIISPSVMESLLSLENRKILLCEDLKKSEKLKSVQALTTSTEQLAVYLTDMYTTLHLNPVMGKTILGKLVKGQLLTPYSCDHLRQNHDRLPC